LHGRIRNPDQVEQSPPIVEEEQHKCTGVADTCECNGNPSLDDTSIDVENASDND
jgi:hypothetical protein